MSLEIVAGLLGSGLVRAVASEVATTLACQAISAAVGSMARPVLAGQVSPSTAAMQPAAARPAEQTVPVAAQTATAGAALTLCTTPSVEILSAIPGRARMRVHGLRDDAARATEVTNTVRALAGVTAVEANVLTGSLLVRFDASQTDVASIVAALEPPVRVRPLRAAERAPYLRLVVG